MIGWRSKPQAAEEEKPRGFDDFDLRLGDLMRGERATLGKSLLDVQRELKIKATFIAAIENADISAFESPGFIAGYVRSYARYLNMDPDDSFQRFCKESGFVPAHGMSAQAAPARLAQARVRPEYAEPLANPNAAFVPRGESVFSRIEPAAVGSLAVLFVLVGAIGYGGWSVLREVQRVQLAPVDEAPVVVAEIDPLQPALQRPAPMADDRTAPRSLADAGQQGTAAPDLMERLYSAQSNEIPGLVSRNGPIAAINPRGATGGSDATVTTADAGLIGPDVVAPSAQLAQGVSILAVRPAWVQVKTADGTVLFEQILNGGEHYTVPATDAPTILRTGNSGSVYFLVDGQTVGPAGRGANIAKDIALTTDFLSEKFAAADPQADKDLQQALTAALAPENLPVE